MKRVREKAPFGNFRGRRKEKMPKQKKNEKKMKRVREKAAFGNFRGRREEKCQNEKKMKKN